MPKLEEFEQRKLYYFRSKSNRKMQKFSGDKVTDHEVSEFEIPNWLLEIPIKEKKKNAIGNIPKN